MTSVKIFLHKSVDHKCSIHATLELFSCGDGNNLHLFITFNTHFLKMQSDVESMFADLQMLGILASLIGTTLVVAAE